VEFNVTSRLRPQRGLCIQPVGRGVRLSFVTAEPGAEDRLWSNFYRSMLVKASVSILKAATIRSLSEGLKKLSTLFRPILPSGYWAYTFGELTATTNRL
jgi:hypothetical protein